MKNRLISIISLVMMNTAVALAQDTGGLVKQLQPHRDKLMLGMIASGALFVILLVWEIIFQVSSKKAASQPAQVNIVGDGGADGEDPIKALLKSQGEAESGDQAKSDTMLDESALPSFLDEDVEDEADTGTGTMSTAKMKPYTPGGAPQDSGDADPFKTLLKQTVDDDEPDMASRLLQKRKAAPSRSMPKRVERADDDPFKTLLRSTTTDLDGSDNDGGKLELPSRPQKKLSISPGPSKPRSSGLKIEVPRQSEPSAPESKEMTEAPPLPVQRKKLDFGAPAASAPAGPSKITLGAMKPPKKGSGRLFARLGGEEEPKTAVKEVPAAPPVSADSLENAIFGGQDKRKSGPPPGTPRKNVVLKLPTKSKEPSPGLNLTPPKAQAAARKPASGEMKVLSLDVSRKPKAPSAPPAAPKAPPKAGARPALKLDVSPKRGKALPGLKLAKPPAPDAEKKT